MPFDIPFTVAELKLNDAGDFTGGGFEFPPLFEHEDSPAIIIIPQYIFKLFMPNSNSWMANIFAVIKKAAQLAPDNLIINQLLSSRFFEVI